jgi:transcriptional regulator with XRE-family HTH domain
MKINNKEIRRRRRELDITQAELSKKTGINITSICFYENGYRIPTLENIMLITVALDCSIEDLVSM